MTNGEESGVPPHSALSPWPPGVFLRVEVPGTPRPQGSKIAIRPGVLREQSKGLPAWRARIAQFASDSARLYGWPLTDVGVNVDCLFTTSRPKSHLTSKGVLRAHAPMFPGRGFGDVDKLARAALDGITGVLIADDSQVVRLRVVREYGARDEMVMWITVAGPPPIMLAGA